VAVAYHLLKLCDVTQKKKPGSAQRMVKNTPDAVTSQYPKTSEGGHDHALMRVIHSAL
jgi:hypothetical protein